MRSARSQSNQILSERRAESLKRTLVREFGVPARALETVGYGEEFLLVDAERELAQPPGDAAPHRRLHPVRRPTDTLDQHSASSPA